MLWLLAKGSLLFYGVKLEEWSWSFQVNKEEKEEQLFASFFQAIAETISAYDSSLEPISLSFEVDIDDNSSKVFLAFFPSDKKVFGISFSSETLEKNEAHFKLSKTFDLSFKELLTSKPDNLTDYSSLFNKQYDQLLLSSNEHINTHIDWLFTSLSLLKEGETKTPVKDLKSDFSSFEEIIHSLAQTKQAFTYFLSVDGKERIEAFDQAINRLNQTVSRMNALNAVCNNDLVICNNDEMVFV